MVLALLLGSSRGGVCGFGCGIAFLKASDCFGKGCKGFADIR